MNFTVTKVAIKDIHVTTAVQELEQLTWTARTWNTGLFSGTLASSSNCLWVSTSSALSVWTSNAYLQSINKTASAELSNIATTKWIHVGSWLLHVQNLKLDYGNFVLSFIRPPHNQVICENSSREPTIETAISDNEWESELNAGMLCSPGALPSIISVPYWPQLRWWSGQQWLAQRRS